MFTIRSHFSGGESACAGLHGKSESIVFARFSRVYDTFSLFRRRIRLRGVSWKVRKYRFCPFFRGLRYVLTFPAVNRPARGLMESQKVSFLSIFYVITIRSHFSSGESACAGSPAETEQLYTIKEQIYHIAMEISVVIIEALCQYQWSKLSGFFFIRTRPES